MIDAPNAAFDENAAAPVRYVTIYGHIDKYARASDMSAWTLTEISNGAAVGNTRSRAEEVFAGHEGTTYPYAMLDGQWRLGQTWPTGEYLRLAGETDGVRGFVSETVTGAQGVFDDLTLRADVSGYQTSASTDLVIGWDTQRAECAADFAVTILTQDGENIPVAQVSGNRKPISTVRLPQLGERAISCIDIAVQRWSIAAAGVTAKVISIALREAYYNLTADDIIRLSVTQDAGMQNGVLAGTAPSACATLELNNADRRFDLSNPACHFAGMRPRDLRLLLYCGFAQQAVRIGTLQVKSWTVSQLDVTASVQAQDVVSAFGEETFSMESCAVTFPCTALELAQEVNRQSGIGAEIFADEAVAAVVIARAPDWQSLSCREALRQIAEACGALVSATPDGRVRVHRLTGAQAYAVNGDNCYEVGLPSTSETALHGVKVEWFDEAGDAHVYALGTAGYAQISANTLIQSEAMAADVAQTVMRTIASAQRREIEWRGNPRVEIGDRLTMRDRYGQATNLRIDRQTISYGGGLRMTSAGYAAQEE